MNKINREKIYNGVSLLFAIGGFVLGNTVENFPEVITAIYGVSIVILIGDILYQYGFVGLGK